MKKLYVTKIVLYYFCIGFKVNKIVHFFDKNESNDTKSYHKTINFISILSCH